MVKRWLSIIVFFWLRNENKKWLTVIVFGEAGLESFQLVAGGHLLAVDVAVAFQT